ncbi:unnamed protein product [Linum trigynum]|uniref:1-phosphatidylinositol 4-kinase n=1 Tax=Linum trigynum TaxID=586398 RepID=A0AAV2E6G6_9ROSI
MVGELEQANLTSYTRCLVGEKVCSVYVNSESQSNLISSRAVAKLGLPIRKHPAPYLLPLLEEEGFAFVTEQVLLQFKIGSYVDEVLCEIVPLKLTHVVLGKPWHDDRNAQRSRRTNHIRLRHCGKLFALKLLSPEEAAEDRSTLLQQLRDEEEKLLEVSNGDQQLREPDVQLIEEVQATETTACTDRCFSSARQSLMSQDNDVKQKDDSKDVTTSGKPLDVQGKMFPSPIASGQHGIEEVESSAAIRHCSSSRKQSRKEGELGGDLGSKST